MRGISRLQRLVALFALLMVLPAVVRSMDTLSTVSQDGVRIDYAVHGAGEPALVLIHGWNCDRSYWREQVGHFAANHRVVAVDLAGHGASGMERRDYTMSRFGHDVAAAVAGDFPVILVGHSMGATVMLEAARLLGDRVLGMISVDALQQVGYAVPDSAAVDAQLAPILADYENMARGFILDMFPENADPALREQIVSDMLAGDNDVAMSAFRGLLKMDYAAAFSELKAPLVLINSLQYPTDMAVLNALYPGSRLETMSGVGHFLMLEKPAAFNAVLEEVIATMVDGR